MKVTFVAPSTRHPSGGVAMIYEFASALAERGHAVHLLHVDALDANVSSTEQIEWFSFADTITHQFAGAPEEVDADTIPSADVIFWYRLGDELPARNGLPVVLIQGYKMLGHELERDAYHAPCPKVCVASWLVDIGEQLGVQRSELVHVPLGLRHEQFRLVRPIPNRPPRISFCYSSHYQKGAQMALEVLVATRRSVPDLEAVAFGAAPPVHEIPQGIRYRTNPPREELVDEIYNDSRVFLCTSEVEGFGLPSIEAMACGAALVTTDNGGARDYAFHDRTALVSPIGDHEAMVQHVNALLHDDDHRVRLATAGQGYVQRFHWERSAQHLESFLEAYRSDPRAFGWKREGS